MKKERESERGGAYGKKIEFSLVHVQIVCLFAITMEIVCFRDLHFTFRVAQLKILFSVLRANRFLEIQKKKIIGTQLQKK